MPKTQEMRVETRWIRLSVTDADWKRERPTDLRRYLEQLLVIRRFEEMLLEVHGEGLLHGPAHASIGQEGGAVGCMSALGSSDKINGTHRMHHQFLAKVLSHATPLGYEPTTDDFPEKMREMVRRTLAEIMGLTPGFCGGRGGSMHLRCPEAGVLGSNAIVGGNLPHAVGYALADKMRGANHVSVAFFGDGAMQNGATYEAMNLAALYGLPSVFFVENNLYAVSTHVREQTRETQLAARGLGLGVPAVTVDGMDLLAVRKAMQWAIEQIHKGVGPVLVEALTYRYLHQSGPVRGSAFGYRDKEEEAQWQERDPLKRYPEQLLRRGVVTEAQLAALERRAEAVVSEALEALVESKGKTGKRRIIPSLWPDPVAVEHGIRGDLSELRDLPCRELADYAPGDLEETKYIECVAGVMLSNMEADDRVFVLGEDVHRLRGGPAGATRGIGDRFPERLLGTPICENGFVGMALGAALNGMRPVVEIMYPDFSLVAADQLFNQIGKVRHMFGGDFAVPVVVRSRVSAGTGYGSQHSMDASGLFALYPGWRIVVPSTPFDYIGLMNAAIRCDDPVLVVEYDNLYPTTGPVPSSGWNYVVPLGVAKTARPGSECTVLTYGSMVRTSVDAAEAAGIDAEVIDLRSLDPLGLDWVTIERSVRRTNRLLIAEQTTRGTAVGARIVAEAQERLFDWLDTEIVHVTGTNASPVVSQVLEEAALAGRDEVMAGLGRLVGRRGSERTVLQATGGV